jgi:hypothetical protein
MDEIRTDFLPEHEPSPAEIVELQKENDQVLLHFTTKSGLALSKKLSDICALGAFEINDRKLVMVCVAWMARQVFVESWKLRHRMRGRKKP